MILDINNLTLEDRETINLVYQLATVVSLLQGKKINLQNLFLLILTDKKINMLAKTIIDEDSNLELCKILLNVDPTLIKSKLILSYINTLKHD